MDEKPITTVELNELYQSLAPNIREELRKHEQEVTAPPGTKLISQGIAPEHLIIISKGSVEISVPAGSRAIFLAVAGEGKVLGLRGIVSDVLPEIDVTTLENCRIILIPREKFLEVLKAHPEIYFAVSKVLSGDLQTAERLLREKPRVVNGNQKKTGRFAV
jgi:CRP-like cAMP-binding protein